MTAAKPKVLWFGVEPTPYLVALQDKARGVLPYDFDVVYERQEVSQPWGLETGGFRVLGKNGARLGLAGLLARVAVHRYAAALLEGWGTRGLAAVGLVGLAAGVPVIVSGDTHQSPPGNGRIRLRQNIRRLLLRRAGATLPGGSRQAAFFLKEGARPECLIVRRMTVDVDAISQHAHELQRERDRLRRDMGLKPEDILFLFVGRLVPEKGVETLIRAMAHVPGARLAVVGDGPERATLETLARENGIGGRVTWLGRVDTDAVVRAYVTADVFVLPSTREPWGLAVNEALACGLPVIVSSAVGCVDDLVTGKGSGVVFPAGDVDGLASALRLVADDPPARRAMSEAARQVMEQWSFREEAAALGKALGASL